MNTHMTMQEWDKTVEKAKVRFVNEVMGERPTQKSVSKNLHNRYSITVLEWLGMALLIAIAIVTAFKMTSVAVPFAQSFFDSNTPKGVIDLFSAAMAITFILFSTSGLIYYKLMDDFSQEIAQQKAKVSKLVFSGGWKGALISAVIIGGLLYFALGVNEEGTIVVSSLIFALNWYLGGLPINLIQYISPRLYLILTYFTAVWLFVVSSAGDGNVFERYGIVLAEVALAYLVANLIEKNAKWLQALHDAWLEQTKPYDNRLENYWTDSKFLPILYRELRESLMFIERQHPEKVNKKYRPNYKLFSEGESTTIDSLIVAEYHRHTGGLRFGVQIENNSEGNDVYVVEPQEKLVQPAKRIPPMGDMYWTIDSLMQDFLIRGLNPASEYAEGQIRKDYEKGYNARNAFRDGAKKYFNNFN